MNGGSSRCVRPRTLQSSAKHAAPATSQQPTRQHENRSGWHRGGTQGSAAAAEVALRLVSPDDGPALAIRHNVAPLIHARGNRDLKRDTVRRMEAEDSHATGKGMTAGPVSGHAPGAPMGAGSLR